ncbi:PLDc N-terminal domain-containing protein [Dyadobacter diqingensis]|uniref:PLDc N-terminal domain-containing protein n=1 Tax=Dyadobacter diqingensis TaxID=2938121 RepID=UPI0035B58D15
MRNLYLTILGYGNSEIVLMICAVAVFLQIIWVFVEILKSKTLDVVSKLCWMLLIIFVPVLGTLLYLYFGRASKYSVK